MSSPSKTDSPGKVSANRKIQVWLKNYAQLSTKSEDGSEEMKATLTPEQQETKTSHVIASPLKNLHEQTAVATTINGAGNLKLEQVMTMKFREVLSSYKKDKETEDLKPKTIKAFSKKTSEDTCDAFPFLRQTSSGRVVKRTQLASMNTKEFWVDRPARAKSTSPKHVNEKMSILKYFTKCPVIPLKSSLNESNLSHTKTDESEKLVSGMRRNSTGSHPNLTSPELEVETVKCPDEVVDPPIPVPDIDISNIKTEQQTIDVSEEDVAKPQDEEMSIEDSAEKSLLRVKLDHDYHEKKPMLPISFSDNETDKDDVEMQEIDTASIKQEVEENISSNDDGVKETTPPSSQDVKAESDSFNKKEDSGRYRKKKRLSSEVRTLIDESIKATKTLNFPTSRLRKPRTKLRNKQRRTECEMLLDMLTERAGPDNLIRAKGRNLPKQIINNTHNIKNLQKVNKIQKLPSPKVKEEGKVDGNVSLEETPIKARDKKAHPPLVAQKKKKAIKMKLKLEKKKKMCLSKEANNFLSSNDSKSAESSPSNSAKPYKSIVLQDLKEKMKAKMEKTEKKSLKFVCNELETICSQKRPPGRPRIHHNPQLPKPAKVSRHGRILGRPPKNISGCAKLPFDGAFKAVLTSTVAPDQSDCFLKVPYVSICSTPTLEKHLLQKKVDGLTDKTCDVVLRDYCRQRSSQRQAESSYKYKDIALKYHQDFTQIIFITSQTNPKCGLNPQIFKELKRALLATAKDNNCKLLLLNGIGGTFCSGVDLNYIVKENKDQRQKVVEDMVTSMREFLRTLITYPKPIVVAVNGLARGLGVSLLLLCDIVYASDKAVFEMPYSQLGQVPEGCASVTLPRNLSILMVNDFLLTGRRLTASEAQQCGLVSQVFWPTDLLEQIIPRVKKMASQNGHVMETTKALLRQKMKPELEAALENECQLLMNQWCQPECQRSIKEFLEQSFP